MKHLSGPKARELEELYPEGRTFFYEGNAPYAVFEQLRAIGLEPQISVEVPANKLAFFDMDEEEHKLLWRGAWVFGT